MIYQITDLEYLRSPEDIFHDQLKVLVVFQDYDKYFGDNFYCIITFVTTEFLPNRVRNRKKAFLLPSFPLIMVYELSQDIIEIAIENFINSKNDFYWRTLSNSIPEFNKNDIAEILYQKKRERIRFNEKLKAKFQGDLEGESVISSI